jgi:long-chain acyl-CoA synthetase
MLIGDGVPHWAAVAPDRPAIDFGSRRVSYGELASRQARIATALEARCAAGDRVGLLLDDPVDFLAGFLAVTRARGVAVPLAPGWTDAETEAVLTVARPALVVTDREAVPGSVARVTPAELESACSPAASRRGVSDEPFYIGFTSGSTGRPKGVVRNHRAWLYSFSLMSLEFGITAEDQVVVPGSLFFSFSLVAALHALFIGARLVLPGQGGPAGLLEELRSRDRATLYALPSTLAELLRLGARRQAHARGVRRIITAGEKLDADIKRQVPSAFPDAGLFEYYGASELGYVSVLRPEDQLSRPDSVGRPVLGAEVAILREDGTVARPGAPGLLCARTEYGFAGYAGDDRGPAAIEHFGWRTVGDLARQDEEGFLYLVGRRDNMVVIRGQNTYPEETEAVLRSVPGVIRAVALPEPSAKPTHLVALVEAESASRDDVLAHCRRVLSGPRLPRRIVVVQRLPLTSTGKVDRQAAVALIAGDM